ncbi:hypothetical protein ACRAWD_25325 [Caulobacter segnis]
MIAGLLALAGCEQKTSQAQTPQHFTPPSLWRVEVVEDSGRPDRRRAGLRQSRTDPFVHPRRAE